jgi:hypothetical protein
MSDQPTTPTAGRSSRPWSEHAVAPIAWFLRSPWRYLGLLIVVVLVQWSLFRADSVFEQISGYPTLDTQNDLTVAEAVAQIRTYSSEAVSVYELFAVIDYAFPLAASLLLSATVLFLVRWANRRTSWNVPPAIALICMLPTLFDYAENIGLAVAVAAGGSEPALSFGIAMKAGKLASLGLASVTVAGTALYALVVGVTRGGMSRRRRIGGSR